MKMSNTVQANRGKRRRTAAVGSAAAQDLWKLEDSESEVRDPEKDLQYFKQACGNIKRLMKETYELKKANIHSGNEINQKRIHSSLLFVTLKKLNRLEKIRSKKAREMTNEMKQKVDTHHLQLQNLLYEVTHLTKEVDKCLQFKSKDEEIELVSVEEFYRDCPPSISKPEETKHDSHRQTLARLEWELEQRKQLAVKCKQLEASKDVISKDIKNKREYLETLAPCLTSILQATIPVQDQLGMRHEIMLAQNKSASFLPVPLYILFVQASAYAEAWDKKMQVIVEGDTEEAKSLKESVEDKDDDSGDSDSEEQQGNKRYRRNTIDKLSEMRKKLLQKHPLTVSIHILTKDKCTLKLSFSYLIALHVVTVKSAVTTSMNLPTPTRDVLVSAVLLDSIFPNDAGRDTPNQANHYQLKRFGMDEFKTYIEELGYPFIWAQHLAGMDFVADLDKDCTSSVALAVVPTSKISSSHMEQIILAIKERLTSRIALQKNLYDLEQGIVPVDPKALSLFCPKIMTRLISFGSIPWEDYKSSPDTLRMLECGVVTQSHLTFKATVERGSAKLIALIALSPHYPKEVPIFVLRIMWNQSRGSAEDAALWDMEKEVNLYWRELISVGSKHSLLANQIQRLMMCFDVYLETEAMSKTVEGPQEFAKEKMFFQQSRGISRSKPYKYVAQQGLFVHR